MPLDRLHQKCGRAVSRGAGHCSILCVVSCEAGQEGRLWTSSVFGSALCLVLTARHQEGLWVLTAITPIAPPVEDGDYNLFVLR